MKMKNERERFHCSGRGFVSESDNVIEVLNFGWNGNVWLPKTAEAGNWNVSVSL